VFHTRTNATAQIAHLVLPTLKAKHKKPKEQFLANAKHLIEKENE